MTAAKHALSSAKTRFSLVLGGAALGALLLVALFIGHARAWSRSRQAIGLVFLGLLITTLLLAALGHRRFPRPWFLLKVSRNLLVLAGGAVLWLAGGRTVGLVVGLLLIGIAFALWMVSLAGTLKQLWLRHQKEGDGAQDRR